MTDFEYYYNNVPGHGLCRNNLIYTSLISKDQKIFVQWYYNDTDYHKGQNQVVDSSKMEEKWFREVNYLTRMRNNFPDLVPEIIKIDFENKKIYLKIDGSDFWEQAGCDYKNFNSVLPDWQEQMLSIIKAHRSLGFYKYSMHPSSYFIVDGRLKSINYFFTYHKDEPNFSIADVDSHIYITRQNEIKKHLSKLGIDWNTPQPFDVLETLCWESFRTNYPDDFIEKVRCLK